MNKIITSSFFIFLSIIFLTYISSAEYIGDSEYNIVSISSADYNCNAQSEFYVGEQVNIIFNGLSTGAHIWTISCENDTVAQGDFFADYSPFNGCINATIANSVCTEYRVQVNDFIWSDPSSSYLVVDSPIIPEFSFIFGVMTIIFALVIFFVIRRN